MEPDAEHDRWLFRADGCASSLRSDDVSLACITDIRTSFAGVTEIALHRQGLTADALQVCAAFNAPGRTAQPLTLRGETPDGPFETERAYLTSVRTGSGQGVPPYWEARLDVPDWWLNRPFWTASMPLPRTGFAVLHRVIGVRGFGSQVVETPAGTLTLRASPGRPDTPEISGLLHHAAPEGEQQLAAWLEDSDALVRRVLAVVGLVLGHRVSSCMRELVHVHGERTSIEFTSPGPIGRARDGLWSHLDLQRWIELGARAYTPELEEGRGLGLAIDYLLTDAPYAETRHILAATALEVLVGAYERSTAGECTFLPRELYEAEVLPRLRAAIDAVSAPQDGSWTDALQVYRNKLPGLNALPLEKRLYRMLDDCGVPYAGLEDEIKAGLRARNDVAHRGVGREDTDLLRHTAVLREVALRTVLMLLGYAGRYYSHVNGQEEALFPPAGPTVVRAGEGSDGPAD